MTLYVLYYTTTTKIIINFSQTDDTAKHCCGITQIWTLKLLGSVMGGKFLLIFVFGSDVIWMTVFFFALYTCFANYHGTKIQITTKFMTIVSFCWQFPHNRSALMICYCVRLDDDGILVFFVFLLCVLFVSDFQYKTSCTSDFFSVFSHGKYGDKQLGFQMCVKLFFNGFKVFYVHRKKN